MRVGDASPAAEDGDLAVTARPTGPVVAWITGDRVVAAAADVPEAFGTPVALGPDDALSGLPALAADGAGTAYAAWQLDPNATPDGDETLRTTSLRDAAAPPPPPPPAVAPVATVAPDTIAPVISGPAISPDRVRVAADPSPFVAAAVRRGARVRFTLSEPAYVRMTVSRLVVRKGGHGRCEGPSRPHGGSVGRVASLERTYGAGPQTARFSGRVGKRALSRGRYVLRLRAADLAANLSTIVGVRFTVC